MCSTSCLMPNDVSAVYLSKPMPTMTNGPTTSKCPLDDTFRDGEFCQSDELRGQLEDKTQSDMETQESLELRAILDQPSRKERSSLLFDIVSRQPDSSFQQLGNDLRSTDNTNVAEFLHSSSRNAPTGPLLDSTFDEGRLRRFGNLRRKADKTPGDMKSQRSLKSPCKHGENVEKCTLMTPEHRRLLQSAADEFAARLNVSEQLLSRLSLCSRRRQAIMSRPPGEERSRLTIS